MKLAFVLPIVFVSCFSKDVPNQSKNCEPTNTGGGLELLSTLAQNANPVPGRFDAPKTSENFDEKSPHKAIMTFPSELAELSQVSAFGYSDVLELRDFLSRLRELGNNEQITEVVFRLEQVTLAPALIEEVVSGLRHLAKKKTLTCYSEQLTNTTYLLASTCHSIAMPEEGMMFLSGFGATPVHIKRLLDKIGVNAQFVHIGDYKGAADPLIRDSPSPAMRETLTAILQEFSALHIEWIAQNRSFPKEKAQALFREGVLINGKEAKARKLIDQTLTFQSLIQDQWKRYEWATPVAPGMGQVLQFLKLAPTATPTADRVAVLYAVGGIIDGKGDDLAGSRKEIATIPTSRAVRVLANDESIKAIVLRISSGGGSALASDIIWQEIELARKKKPVIVSMGEVAASGGYYIAAGADRIFANRTTLTGSIGVIGGKFSLNKGLRSIGVDTYPMSSGGNSHLFSPLADWTAQDKQNVKNMMENVYERFLERIAKGRPLTRDQIHVVAQGRVWTGNAAMEHRLIDQIGGLEDAIAYARKVAKLDANAPVEVYPPAQTLEEILSNISFGPFAAKAHLTAQLQQLSPSLAAYTQAIVEQGLSFTRTPVQVTYFPPYIQW